MVAATAGLPSIFWQQVLEFSQYQNAFIMMPSSQLCLDDLRNVGQALVMHKSLKILPVIKLILDYVVFFLSAFPESKERKEDGHSASKTWYGWVKSHFFEEKRNNASVAPLLIIKEEVILRELSSSANLTRA